jgi:hypothetical protein
MPVARYFLFVGAALLALLFVVGSVLPSMPAVETTNTAAELPAIRIHSDRKWPQRVVFDTSAPTIVAAPTQTASMASPAAAPVRTAEVSSRVTEVSSRVTARDAFAQLTRADMRKPEVKPVRKRRVAKRRANPPMIVVAQRPQFGLFANNIW